MYVISFLNGLTLLLMLISRRIIDLNDSVGNIGDVKSHFTLKGDVLANGFLHLCQIVHFHQSLHGGYLLLLGSLGVVLVRIVFDRTLVTCRSVSGFLSKCQEVLLLIVKNKQVAKLNGSCLKK